jgi:hypothetical protein
MNAETFEERSAILEFDTGMPRAEAEALAVAELYNALQACPPLGIIAELARADRVRHGPLLADCLQACGLVGGRAPAWGFDWCVFDGSTYRPADPDELGRSCLIVPSTEDGALVDLVAMDLGNLHMATRLGAADAVGADAINFARETQELLYVFGNTATWLRGGALGAVIVDWRRAGALLDGVPTIVTTMRLAKQLHGATAQCWPRPNIYIAAKVPHAA